MRVLLRKLGNSSGVIIPKALLDEAGLSVGNVIDMRCEEGELVLTPVRRGARAGWSEASQSLAEAGDDAPVWPEFGNADDEALDW